MESICPSIHLSVHRHIIVHLITSIPFELFSQNFVRLLRALGRGVGYKNDNSN